MEDLFDLYETRKNLENRLENYFGGGQVYSGDEGYQDILYELECVEEQIEELENN